MEAKLQEGTVETAGLRPWSTPSVMCAALTCDGVQSLDPENLDLKGRSEPLSFHRFHR